MTSNQSGRNFGFDIDMDMDMIELSKKRGKCYAIFFSFYLLWEKKQERKQQQQKRKILSIGHFSPIRKNMKDFVYLFFYCTYRHVFTCLSQHPKLTGIKSLFLLLLILLIEEIMRLIGSVSCHLHAKYMTFFYQSNVKHYYVCVVL